MRLLLAVPAFLLLASGCSGASTGTPTLSRQDVEREVSAQLADDVGRAPERVRCPDDLLGKVEQKMRCELVDGDLELGVTVTVTTVQGMDVAFDYVVDEAPVTP